MIVVSASEPEEQRMDYGERTTGTRDEHYNLISVLYHALHGAENCDRYAADAEVSGDERLAAFFREAQTLQTELADRAKELLGIDRKSTRLNSSHANISYAVFCLKKKST